MGEATPKVPLLAARPFQEALAHQPGLEDSEVVAEASRVALVDEVALEAVEASEEIEVLAVVEEVGSAEAAEEGEALVVAAVVSDTSPTATVLQTALLLVHEAHERADSVVDAAEVASAAIAAQEVVMATSDEEAAVVGMIADPAAQTTSPLAAESVRATAVERVGMVARIRESVGTKATATTILDNEGGIERSPVHGFVKGYFPFFRLIVSRQRG